MGPCARRGRKRVHVPGFVEATEKATKFDLAGVHFRGCFGSRKGVENAECQSAV